MTLQEIITEDIKKAMKTKDAAKLAPLRMLKASIANTAIEKKITDLTDIDVMGLLRREIKKRNDTLTQMATANQSRPELEKTELHEIAVLESYLPKQMGLDELKSLVVTVIGEMGATTKKDMGKVIKTVTARLNGASDGKTISGVVQSLLP